MMIMVNCRKMRVLTVEPVVVMMMLAIAIMMMIQEITFVFSCCWHIPQ